MIVAERAARIAAESQLTDARAELIDARAEAAHAQADLTSSEALIAHLKLAIEKLRRELYGTRSERKARLLDQMELKLEELEAAASEDELAARAASTETVAAFERKRPSRRPFPAHLPRERVVIAAPEACPCCGSTRMSKLGEDVTETLEVVPRRWKVIETVRERFSCRDCETITQPPAPFHVTPRGFAGPNLLATILFEKFGQHQPLNRQSERYGREGIDLSVSTLADQVGACATALRPLYGLIEAHVLSAQRLHGDNTTEQYAFEFEAFDSPPILSRRPSVFPPPPAEGDLDEAHLGICNGNRIDDRDRCAKTACSLLLSCERVALRR